MSDDLVKRLGAVRQDDCGNTDRMTALKELLAKVHVGRLDECPYSTGRTAFSASALDRLLDAYNGSLDAAKALHEAVLPGWEWGVTFNADQPECIAAFVAEWGADENGFEATSSTPARAWLIAILRALIAAQEQNETKT